MPAALVVTPVPFAIYFTCKVNCEWNRPSSHQSAGEDVDAAQIAGAASADSTWRRADLGQAGVKFLAVVISVNARLVRGAGLVGIVARL
jgi:hypothetical protein